MEKIKNKSFETWLYEDVGKAFGISRFDDNPLWEFFDTLQFDKTNSQHSAIEELRVRLKKYVDSWNEDEIKFLFISPLINLVNYSTSDKYKIFTQRPMSVSYDNDTKITSGKVEFMIAKGIQTPQKPFFSFTNTSRKTAEITTH